MWVIPSRQTAKNAKAVLSKSRTTCIPFLTKTRKLLAVMIFLSPSRKGRKGCAQQITDNVYSFPTKTIKILAVMQGVRPLFLSGTVVLRSKLRPAGTRKKQPSFLRLASPGIAVPAYDPYLHHTATSCKDNTCNTLIINMLLHSSTVGVGFIPILLPRE